MPEKKTREQGSADEREGKAPTTEAGEYIREEMEALQKGEGAESREQAIAIGLSRARRAGVKVPVPQKGKTSERTRRKAAQDLRKGAEAGAKKKTSGTARVQKARAATPRRTKADRSEAARKAAATRKKRQQEQQGA
jgi:hypothetical protein